MNISMISAVNTLGQLQKQLDIIGNNIANVDTNGFKEKQATFTDLLAQAYNNQPDAKAEAGRLTPNGIRQGFGAKLGQVQVNSQVGVMTSTGRPLDAALQKEGQYFKVLSQQNNTRSIQYTRDGSFELSPVSPNETMLVTSSGDPLLDENNNPIIIKGTAQQYNINPNGRLDVTMTNGPVQSFNLGVAQINHPQAMEQEGNNLIGVPNNIPAAAQNNILTNLTGPLRSQISISSGMLEQSNVDLSKEMTDLINVQRSYQFQTRAVTISDQMMGIVDGLR